MSTTKVLSLGGSIVSPPEGFDIPFLTGLLETLNRYLKDNPKVRLVIVVGGGGPARTYQQVYQSLTQQPDSDEMDKIGIAATRLNAQLLKALFQAICHPEVIIDPYEPFEFKERVLIAAGWKPGFSTDYDAVVLAERFNADTVVNLSNITQVYTDDPKINRSAKPIERINWTDFRRIVGNEWTPGKNLPFDPIAAKHASRINLRVIVADGKELTNLEKVLNDGDFHGTTIGPE